MLSGDVHIAAAFQINHKRTKKVIYQLTSSAITYHLPFPRGFILSRMADGSGKTQEGHRYERVALYSNTNFSIIRVDPRSDEIHFRLYGADAAREIDVPEGLKDLDVRPQVHSIATIKLEF